MLLLLVLVLLVPGSLWAMGTYEPVKLAIMQEKVLGLIKGGSTAPREEIKMDGCVEITGKDGQVIYRAIRRVERTVRFADGSEMTIIYSEPPEPNPQCP
jgi:hypothetical protein